MNWIDKAVDDQGENFDIFVQIERTPGVNAMAYGRDIIVWISDESIRNAVGDLLMQTGNTWKIEIGEGP